MQTQSTSIKMDIELSANKLTSRCSIEKQAKQNHRINQQQTFFAFMLKNIKFIKKNAHIKILMA